MYTESVVNRLVVSRTFVTGAAVLALAVPAAVGGMLPDYSHTSQFISELGAIGMPQGVLVSFGGFLPTGLLAGAFLVAAAPAVSPTGAARIGYGLLFFIPVAYIGAAVAPCDLGCPAAGSVRQQFHNLLGVMQYVGGGVGLVLLATKSSSAHSRVPTSGVLAVAGAVTLVAFLAMAAPGLAPWRGLSQRVAETMLFGSLLVIGWRLTRNVTDRTMTRTQGFD